MKKFRLYFIGGVMQRTDDVFEQVKAEVLFNFTVFFILANVPYIFVSLMKPVHLLFSLSTLAALITALVIVRRTNNVQRASYFFLINFAIQDIGHYIVGNGRMEAQASLFALLFILCGYLLLSRGWGLVIGIVVVAMYMTGVYNLESDFALWHVPVHLADPPEKGPLKCLALIPLLLNMYLISEFVKARQKAEKQLARQKQLIEEKQKEILDSIYYAQRIQRALIASERYMDRTINRLTGERSQ